MESCPPLLCCNPSSNDWIGCDICQQWYHYECVGLNTASADEIAIFHCPLCVLQHGELVLKRKSKRAKLHIDYQALDRGERYAVDKTWHPHLDRFLGFLDQPSIDSDLGAFKLNTVSCFCETLDHKNTSGPLELRNNTECTADVDFSGHAAELENYFGVSPVLFTSGQAHSNCLGMQIPPSLTVDEVCERVGRDHPVEVMDVLTQEGVSNWTMGRWVDYFNSLAKDRVRNVILLEISDSSVQFTRPLCVREADLVDAIWESGMLPRPKITTYCLMLVANCFTDFHIDFGGTLVYYTVFQGRKLFIFFPPTEDNLICYQDWCSEDEQNYIWFPDFSTVINRKRVMPTGGFKVELHAGDLFFIPLGWIHAVYTPEDLLVIGGNFLTSASMPMQLRINQLEQETRVPAKYRFPQFNRVLWIASLQLLAGRIDMSFSTIASLIGHLKTHATTARTVTVARSAIPNALDPLIHLETLRRFQSGDATIDYIAYAKEILLKSSNL